MTDNEIIKALECCYNERENCLNCPYKDATVADDEVYCDEMVVKDALDLIKRQRAEIERLKKYDKERDIILHSRLTEKARTDGIEEFVEKLKKAFYYNDAIKHNIDNLAKEMSVMRNEIF